MDPRFRWWSTFFLDYLAPQSFFELGELRSLRQYVPLKYIAPQDVAVLPPEEAADDGGCWYACDEEEEAPHGHRRAAAAAAGVCAQRLGLASLDVPALAVTLGQRRAAVRMIKSVSDAAWVRPARALEQLGQKLCLLVCCCASSVFCQVPRAALCRMNGCRASSAPQMPHIERAAA